MRARVSPIIVDLKWPTCISFAILGDEKSITALLTGSAGAQFLMPFINMSWILYNNTDQLTKVSISNSKCN